MLIQFTKTKKITVINLSKQQSGKKGFYGIFRQKTTDKFINQRLTFLTKQVTIYMSFLFLAVFGFPCRRGFLLKNF